MKIFPGCLTYILTTLFALGFIIPLSLSVQAKELDANTVASVNGVDLSLAMFQFLIGSRQREDQESTEFALSAEELSAIHAQSAEDLVLTEVLAQEALKLQIDQIEMNQLEIDLARKTLLAQLMVRRIMENIHVTEEEIRAVYDAEKSTNLYRFNLWMAPSKEQAEKLLSHLKDKKPFKHNFEKIETPWLDQTELDPSVIKTVEATKIGDFVSQTIEQDGLWKVVQVIDKNKFDKPAFEEAQEVIKADLIQSRVDAEIKKLSSKADINVNHNLIH